MAVIGASPVSFVDSTGKQQEIPLSLLSFKQGAIDPTGWPGYAGLSGDKKVVDGLLSYLVSQNLLRPPAA